MGEKQRKKRQKQLHKPKTEKRKFEFSMPRKKLL